jgi:hypothetical protein
LQLCGELRVCFSLGTAQRHCIGSIPAEVFRPGALGGPSPKQVFAIIEALWIGADGENSAWAGPR